MKGYRAWSRTAPVSRAHLFVAGSYTSGIWDRVPSGASPDVASTLPSARVVLVAYHRKSVMSAPRVQVCVTGSKIDVMFVPSCGGPFTPPTTITRPSARVDCPAQCRSPNVAGARANVPVVGSQTRALSPVDQTRTLLVDSVTMCFACIPQSSNGPHAPVSDGAVADTVVGAGGGTTAAGGGVAGSSAAGASPIRVALTTVGHSVLPS